MEKKILFNLFFLFKETEKKLLRPLLSSQNTVIQQTPPPPKSAAKGYNNGIPVFTHERAEERAFKKNNVNGFTQNINDIYENKTYNKIYLENDFIITKLNHFNSY